MRLLQKGVCFSLVALAAALGGTQVKADDWKFMVGGGALMVPEYEGSEDYTVAPLPLVDIRWKDRVFLNAQEGLGWNAYKGRNLRLGPVVTYYWGSDDRPSGINDVDPGFQVGAFAEFAFDHWKFDTKILQSVTGSGEGLAINAGAAFGMKVEKDWTVVLRADTTFLSANEMKTYFGISDRESSSDASGLAKYDPGMGFKDVGLGLSVSYQVSDSWSIHALAKGSYLLGEAADSPLVTVNGSEVQFMGGMGVAVHF